MILFIVTIWVLYFFYHRFEVEVRHNLWEPRKNTEQKPIPLILSGLKSQFNHLNEKNLFLSSLIEFRLNLITFRELMIRLCLSRISSVLLLGVLLLVWNAPYVLLVFVVTMGLWFFIRGKKWGPTIFPLVILGIFYLIADMSLDFLRSALQSSPESPLWFFLADGRFQSVLFIFGIVVFLSLILNRPGIFFLGFFPLFLLGFVPPINFLSVVFAETIASSVLLFKRYYRVFRPIKAVLLETMIIKGIVISFLIVSWSLLKGIGLLDLRVMGSIWDKKVLFLLIWSLSEVILTAVLMFWGHFRYKSLCPDPSDLISFEFPKFDFNKDSISSRQRFHWFEIAQLRQQSINSVIDEIKQSPVGKYPKNLLSLSEKEVESLLSFIELTKSKS